MIKLYDKGVYVINGKTIIEDSPEAVKEIKQLTGKAVDKAFAKTQTIAYPILQKHNISTDSENLEIKFDSLTSHDITYVGIIETAIASGLKSFPLPYVLTNCHNSLCAVGGTINEDDHAFALSAAKKFGGVYVPPNLAVIHQYNREMMAGCGKMILGSDSHTRYGALGTMAIGEGGGELAKQLLNKPYCIKMPEVIAVYLKGAPMPWVGPQDVALSIIGKVFSNGYVKNKVMEFIGEGVHNLSLEYRSGIDVMTTETTCLTSIWKTDEKTEEFLDIHGRKSDYKKLESGSVAYYDGMIEIDLSEIKPSIALPFHPSNVYTIDELKNNAGDILRETEKKCMAQLDNKSLKLDLVGKLHNGSLYVDQGIVAGCAGGTYDNICDVADIMNGHSIGNEKFSMSVYPSSQPVYIELIKNGAIEKLMNSGVIVRSAFCGPCFGAGDTPANGELSIRHTTRNFPNREGSKPGESQISSVALMDARSIAATAINKGKLTSAEEVAFTPTKPIYTFNGDVYKNRVNNCIGRANAMLELVQGPNIRPWPTMPRLTDNLLLKCIAYIDDSVTTTDELIPSGEASSYRSNPYKLSEFTLSRKVPEYVERAKAVREIEISRESGEDICKNAEIGSVLDTLKLNGIDTLNKEIGIGSTFFANKPGDGSAREQAASCQKVLGGWANIAVAYATKRYRSNLINWGILPFITNSPEDFELNDYIYIENIREKLAVGSNEYEAYLVRSGTVRKIKLGMDSLSEDEKEILLSGCLINHQKDNT